MSLLHVKNLDLSIHGVPILDKVSFRIEPGEIVAITGESGSGKSMTALGVMGLTPEGTTAAGTIRLNETEILEAGEASLCQLRGREVGMVFQEPMTALNPLHKIGTQVAETILQHDKVSKSVALDRAATLLRRVGLDMPIDRYPHELSGGQRQRVVIAIAIAMRPKLLIADEPTTALDVTTQARILDLLQDLVADYGMGLMIITHDLAVVSDIADKIVVMKSGQVVETGETAELFRNMQHPYTRALFKASSHKVDLPPAKAAPPLLEVASVARDYAIGRPSLFGARKTYRALSDITFSLDHGERVGLVGESGCGKSTLTRAILGLEDVQEGTIHLDGQPVFNDRTPNLTLRQRMQVVFQDPFSSFNPRHKVWRLVSEPFYLRKSPPKGAALRRAVEAALLDVGLQPSDADKYIHEFSGGQRQRIAIARALINEPDLIVFDEAVSALDVSVRAQILDLLAELCKSRSFTYLFISHDLSVVRSITDRVLVMQAGRIVEQGPTEQVFTHPKHPYTQTLIDAVPVLPEIGEVKAGGTG